MHRNNKQEAINDDESHASMDSPPASDSPVLHSEDKKQGDEEQYHVQLNRNVKVSACMAHVPRKRKSAKSIVSTTLKKKRPTFLDVDLDIGLDFGNDPNDIILMRLDSLMAADDTTNLFDFK